MMSWIEKYRDLKKQFWKNIEEAHQYYNPCLPNDPLSPVFTPAYWAPATTPEHMEEIEDTGDDKEE